MSLLRLFASGIVTMALLNDFFYSAFVIFFLAALTDFFDGFIARFFQQTSVLGAYLDPLADKCLIISTFLTLWGKGHLPLWIVVMTLVREAQILLGIAWLYLAKKPFEVSPIFIGKINTTLQMLFLVFYLYYLPNTPPHGHHLALGVVVVSVSLSMILYTKMWWKLAKNTPYSNNTSS